MNIWGATALAIGGGAVVRAVDKKFDKYTYDWKVTSTRTIKLRPGTMGAAALCLLLAIIPGSNAEGMRAGLAAIGIGGLATEGLDLYSEHVQPSVDKALVGRPKPKSLGQGQQQNAGVPKQPAYEHVGHGRFAGDLAMQQAALRWGRRARAA